MSKQDLEIEHQHIYTVVECLKSGKPQQQFQAALAIRAFAANTKYKQVVRQAGGMLAILQLLDGGHHNPLTLVATETLCCLAADDMVNRDQIRKYDGIEKLVALLDAGPFSEVTHRAILALRIFTDKEQDWLAILKANGVFKLVNMLKAGNDTEIAEYAAAQLCKLSAGSQQVKNQIRECGAIPLLIQLIRDDPREVAAELAASVIRNLIFQNQKNKQAIYDLGGLPPLFELLQYGQEKLHNPLQCQVFFQKNKKGFRQSVQAQSTCCFSYKYAHLIVANTNKKANMVTACVAPTNPSPRDKNALRYSLLRKIQISEPNNSTLELNFLNADKDGVLQILDRVNPPLPKKVTQIPRLERIVISPCSAIELKGNLMKLLTRMHVEREFRSIVQKQQQAETKHGDDQNGSYDQKEADLINLDYQNNSQDNEKHRKKAADQGQLLV